jgi:hypothetical protein
MAKIKLLLQSIKFTNQLNLWIEKNPILRLYVINCKMLLNKRLEKYTVLDFIWDLFISHTSQKSN